MNNIDGTKKIQFNMEVAEEIVEFPDLKLTFDIFPAPVFLRTALKTFLKVLHYD